MAKRYKKSEPAVPIQEWSGLNNKAEPRTLTLGELTRADNIDLDNRKRIRRRRGYNLNLSAANITAAWGSEDETRMFLIDDGTLKEYQDPVAVDIASGFPGTEAYFADAGDRYFVSCGGVSGVIDAFGYRDLAVPTPTAPRLTETGGRLPAGRRLVSAVCQDASGRQGGACQIQAIDLPADSGINIEVTAQPGFTIIVFVSRANDDQLREAGRTDIGGSFVFEDDPSTGPQILDPVQLSAGPPPAFTGPIAYHEGCLWGAVIDRPLGLSFLFRSEPFWTHLFNPTTKVETVQGQVRMLASTGEGLVVGTDRNIHALIPEQGLVDLAQYGVIPGQNSYYERDSQKVLFWTQEGICEALPFANLTNDRLSAKAGDRCCVGMVRQGGFSRLMVVTHTDPDDEAPNPR